MMKRILLYGLCASFLMPTTSVKPADALVTRATGALQKVVKSPHASTALMAAGAVATLLYARWSANHLQKVTVTQSSGEEWELFYNAPRREKLDEIGTLTGDTLAVKDGISVFQVLQHLFAETPGKPPFIITGLVKGRLHAYCLNYYVRGKRSRKMRLAQTMPPTIAGALQFNFDAYGANVIQLQVFEELPSDKLGLPKVASGKSGSGVLPALITDAIESKRCSVTSHVGVDNRYGICECVTKTGEGGAELHVTLLPFGDENLTRLWSQEWLTDMGDSVKALVIERQSLSRDHDLPSDFNNLDMLTVRCSDMSRRDTAGRILTVEGERIMPRYDTDSFFDALPEGQQCRTQLCVRGKDGFCLSKEGFSGIRPYEGVRVTQGVVGVNENLFDVDTSPIAVLDLASASITNSNLTFVWAMIAKIERTLNGIAEKWWRDSGELGTCLRALFPMTESFPLRALRNAILDAGIRYQLKNTILKEDDTPMHSGLLASYEPDSREVVTLSVRLAALQSIGAIGSADIPQLSANITGIANGLTAEDRACLVVAIRAIHKEYAHLVHLLIQKEAS